MSKPLTDEAREEAIKAAVEATVGWFECLAREARAVLPAEEREP